MIKKASCLIVSMLFCITSLIAADKSAISSAGSIIWAGIDYSQVKMIGPDFNEPDAIFPGMLVKWNNLFLKERITRLKSNLDKEIIPDVEGTGSVNKNASAGQITVVPGPDDVIDKTHITDEIIADQVKKYKMISKSGIALVLIADRFIKVDNKGIGAVYVVYFDVETRKVLKSKREINGAGGFGFRNFWFRVIKETSVKI